MNKLSVLVTLLMLMLPLSHVDFTLAADNAQGKAQAVFYVY